ncbi:unnamed protein product [Phytophthora fragariaefolia]|uniref:RxLR effector protein n=1 Tax=Phytophthora fragariaefolia TaxID=1490495 RepID=A0A9W6Y8S4_9STRA|nr:unnamed protein product [Phytophthora fragariaefolia]
MFSTRQSETSMRLLSLLVVAIAFLGANEYGVGAETEQVHPQIVSAQYVNALNTGSQRLLRAENGLNGSVKENSEERATWSNLKALFPGTTEHEVKAIKANAERFSKWKNKDRMPLDVYNRWKSKGASRSEAMKWGLRYEKYLENPSAYDKQHDDRRI